MRALLVVNPHATSTSMLVQDVIAQALSAELKVDVLETEHRGHAATVAQEAAELGYEVVVVHGGDGTVNEVVNGLMRGGDPTSSAGERPALAVVPGGSTNVFARVVGYPADPIEATGDILEALRTQRRRTVSLGKADDRYFTFCAGLGYDAEVVGRVEAHRADGRRSTHALYVRSAVLQFLATQRSEPAITLTVPGEAPIAGLHLVIACNTTPWTYLATPWGDRPVEPCPEASFDTGLDLIAPRRLSAATTLRHVRQMLSPRGAPHGRSLLTRHDLPEVVIESSRPLALQVDGDYLGEVDRVVLRSAPAALDVVV